MLLKVELDDKVFEVSVDTNVEGRVYLHFYQQTLIGSHLSESYKKSVEVEGQPRKFAMMAVDGECDFFIGTDTGMYRLRPPSQVRLPLTIYPRCSELTVVQIYKMLSDWFKVHMGWKEPLVHGGYWKV